MPAICGFFYFYMVYSDTSGGQGLIQDCESLTNLGRGNISGNTELLQDFTRFINNRYYLAQSIILESQSEWDFDDNNKSDYPIITRGLVANQQDYPLPISDEKLLKVKRLEITYDGTSWNKAWPIDLKEVNSETSSSNSDTRFSLTHPRYDIQFGSIFLYPIPDTTVASALKMWISREVDVFTVSDTTKEPGFAKLFHNYLSVGASYDWALFKNLPTRNALKDKLDDIEIRMRKFFSSQQQDRRVGFTLLEEDYS